MSRDSKQNKFGKAKYKAGFLGCLNCSSLCGDNIIDQALRDLVYGDQKHVVGEVPRFSITVDKKELRITQTIRGKGGKKKVPLNGVLMKDLLFAAQGSTKDLEGMVGCIYYRYNSTPNGWPLTVHGYLFDSAKSANRFMRHLKQYTDTPENQEILLKREKELVDGGWLVPVPPSGQSTLQPTPTDQPSMEDSCQDVEGRRGLRRTPFPGADINPQQMTGYRTNSVFLDHAETNPPPIGPTKGPYRLPRTVLLLDTGDEPCSQGNEPIRHSQLPTRSHSNISNQLPRIQPLDYGDQDLQRQDSRSPDHYAPTGGLPRDLSPTYLDYRESSEWSTDGSSIVSKPRVVSCIAAELKSKLGQGPILLPPKDYDTINRTRGNMVGIEARKCLNPDIVGSSSTVDDDENTSF